MNQVQSSISDKITVIVFKDNFAARSFQVPLKWISKLGFLLGLLILFSAGATFVAVKFYRIAAQSNLSRIQGLEIELSDLKSALKTTDNAPSNPPTVTQDQKSNPNATSPPLIDQQDQNSPLEKTADEIDLNSEHPNQLLGTSLFHGLNSPAGNPPLPDPSTLRVSIRNPRFSWQKNSLQVRFALQYTHSDQGSQQGRIIILARGPETLLTYPQGTLNRAAESPLINFKKGEPFSVSRFRETRATFGPLTSKDSVQEVEILILSKTGELLMEQKFPISKKAPPLKPSVEAPKTIEGES